MNSCPVRAPKATPFLAEGKPAEAPLAVRKDAGRRSRYPVITQTKPGRCDLATGAVRSLVARTGWFNVWSALVITLTLLGAPIRAEFAYVANLNSNNVSGYTINPTTGALTAIAGSPFAAGGSPGSVAVDPSGKFAYVANEFGNSGNSVSGYTINPSTGALTAITGSPFAAGVYPRSVAVDPSGKFAYVANEFGNNLYSVSGSVSGYTIDPTTGALTAITGSPFATGGLPLSVAVDPSGKFAYVANYSDNNVSGYTINPATGALTPIIGSPFPAGTNPGLVAVDPSGKFAYVANSSDNNVSGYTINSATGALTAIAGSPFLAGSGPFSVAVDPSGKFAYVANSSDNTVSGYTIAPATGALTTITGSPFPAGISPFSF